VKSVEKMSKRAEGLTDKLSSRKKNESGKKKKVRRDCHPAALEAYAKETAVTEAKGKIELLGKKRQDASPPGHAR